MLSKCNLHRYIGGESQKARIVAAVVKNLSQESNGLSFEFVTSLMRDTAYALIPATTRQNFHIALASTAAGLPRRRGLLLCIFYFASCSLLLRLF